MATAKKSRLDPSRWGKGKNVQANLFGAMGRKQPASYPQLSAGNMITAASLAVTPSHKSKPSNPNTAPGSIGPCSSSTTAANKKLGQQTASAYGWGSGAQWEALNNIVMAESGWCSTISNPSSGAFGIAQALGHGNGAATRGNLANQYGGYGVSDQIAQDANSGSASAQITWLLQYILQTYKTPVNAWNFHRQNGYY